MQALRDVVTEGNRLLATKVAQGAQMALDLAAGRVYRTLTGTPGDGSAATLVKRLSAQDLLSGEATLYLLAFVEAARRLGDGTSSVEPSLATLARGLQRFVQTSTR